MAFGAPDYVKQANKKTLYNRLRAEELKRCATDLIHFCENYVMIQHPIQGNIPMKLYPFQKDMLETFVNYDYVVALTARQLGKCLTANITITYNDEQVKLKDLIPMTPREKIITYLEDLLLKLSK